MVQITGGESDGSTNLLTLNQLQVLIKSQSVSSREFISLNEHQCRNGDIIFDVKAFPTILQAF